MQAVLENHRVWQAPTRKLTDEEIEALIENYDYDPRYLDPDYDDGKDLEPIYDRFGNPTESTIMLMYEKRHGISASEGPMKLDEFKVWLDDILAEE